jgi:chromosome segregation ATPase
MSAGAPAPSELPSVAAPAMPSQPTAPDQAAPESSSQPAALGAAAPTPLVGSGSGVVIPPAGGEHTSFLSSEWSTEYLDTHDEHEANLQQWMEDTDAVIHTQARQISVLSKTTSIQKMLLKLQQDKTMEIEGKLDPLIETMKSVQEALDQLPEIQEKLGALENGLEQTEAIVDGLRTQLEEAVRKIEQDSMLLKELHEWRDGYVEEQEGKHTKTSAALETLRSEVDEEMEALKKAFADAQEMLDKFDPDAMENMVDQDALKDAMTDIMALMEQQIATRGSKQDIKDLEEQLAKIAELKEDI